MFCLYSLYVEFQFSVVGLNLAQAQQLYGAVTNQDYYQGISQQFGGLPRATGAGTGERVVDDC